MSAPTWLTAWSTADGAGRARDGFAQSFNADPDGVWMAPGRVNLIGEHTDYNGGLCLPLALPHRTYAAIARREDGRIRACSAQMPGQMWTGSLAEVGPGRVEGWASYVAGVAWALMAAGHQVSGFDAYFTSCVPTAAGLSSSAALEGAIGVGIVELDQLLLGGPDQGRATLVQACVRAENEIAGAPTGGMDQAASLRCRAGHALLLDCLDGTVRQVPFDLSAHGLDLLVIDTRAAHQHAGGEYGQRRAQCEQAATILGVDTLRAVVDLPAALDQLADPILVKRVRHVVSEIARVVETVALLDAGRTAAIGELFTASHASLRDDYQVSCPELDLAVDAALDLGALGARMTGGGFGGSAIALIEAGRHAEFAEHITGAFTDHGFTAPAFLQAPASPPAGRA